MGTTAEGNHSTPFDTGLGPALDFVGYRITVLLRDNGAVESVGTNANSALGDGDTSAKRNVPFTVLPNSTFALVSGDGDTDNSSFTINGDQLLTTAEFLHPAQSSYYIRVQVTMPNAQTYEEAYTITVNNINDTPTTLNLSQYSVPEGLAVGTAVGTLSAVDEDTGDTHTYTLLDDSSYPDNTSFTISGNTLQTAAIFSHSTKSEYTIQVQATDSGTGNLTVGKVLKIHVSALGIDDPTIDENHPAASPVGSLNLGLPAVASADAGGQFSAFALQDGTLWMTGNNAYGQLGDGTLSNRSLPVQVVASGVTQVSAGTQHTMFIKSDGSLWGMGSNASGRLGDGTTDTRLLPVQVEPSGVTQVVAGEKHTMYIKSDGSLWVMGSNTTGQLGDGTTSSRHSPVQIEASGVAQISAGVDHSLYVKTDGSLWAMGDNTNGQLGDGTTTQRNTPVQIESSGVQSASAGENFSLYVKTDGSLMAMGKNSDGQLGDGTTADKSTPVQIESSGVTSVSAGQFHTLYIKSDGSLWAMGLNDNSRLGDGTTNATSTPIQIRASGASKASAGGTMSLFVTSDGTLWGMGGNALGQIGASVSGALPSTVAVTFELVSGAGDTDNAAFAVDGSFLTANASFDFETKSSYSVRVRATPTSGPQSEAAISITVNDTNDLPTSSDKTVTTNDGTPYIFVTGDFAFTDTDAGHTLQQIRLQAATAGTLWVDADSSGAVDNGESAVVNNDVVALADIPKLKFLSPLGSFGASFATFQFEVSDGTDYSSPPSTITVNVDSTPTFSALSSITGNEDSFIPLVDLANGQITTFPVSGVTPTGNPREMVQDSAGNFFVMDTENHRILKVTPVGVGSVFAGTGSKGRVDGTGTGASFDQPAGVAIDASDNLYVGEGEGKRIRKVTPAGVVTTLAGDTSQDNPTTGDILGNGATARFNDIWGLVYYPPGNDLYFTDVGNHKIKKLDLDLPDTDPNYVTLVAGSSLGHTDDTGAAARFNFPHGITVDSMGNLYVADLQNNRIRKVTQGGVVTTIAGSGTAASVDGAGTSAQFQQPGGSWPMMTIPFLSRTTIASGESTWPITMMSPPLPGTGPMRMRMGRCPPRLPSHRIFFPNQVGFTPFPLFPMRSGKWTLACWLLRMATPQP